MNNLTDRQPTVTVFMAVFNGAKYIEEAIKSVLDQDFSDFELLIVNDGSTDITLDIIAEFNDPRIRVVHNECNKGLTYTRNHGLREAKGKYFAILDSDDIATPGRLKTQVTFLEANPQVAMCGSNALFIDGDGKAITGYKVPVGDSLSHQLVIYNIFINSTLMMRTDIMREAGGYREMAPAEDFDLSFRISFKYETANLDGKFVVYREHGNNTSRVQTEKLDNALIRIIEHIHTNLNIPINEHLIKVHRNLLTYDVYDINLSEFKNLLTILKHANNMGKYYSESVFNNFLFETWFMLLRIRNEQGIMSLYFTKPLFEWEFVTFKQLRKIIKQAFFTRIKPNNKNKSTT